MISGNSHVYLFRQKDREVEIFVEKSIVSKELSMERIQQAVGAVLLSPEGSSINRMQIKAMNGRRVSYATDANLADEKNVEVDPLGIPDEGFTLHPTHDIVKHFLKHSPKEKHSRVAELTKEFARPFKHMFKTISYAFSRLTKLSAKQMAWDFSLLQDAVGTFSSDGKITRHQAVRYCRKLLERENGVQFKKLTARLAKAEFLAKEIEILRRRKITKPTLRFTRLIERIKSEIKALPENSEDRVLIPVGFKNNDEKWIDAWLEIEKCAGGKCNVKVISLDPATENYFKGILSEHQKGRSLVREYRNVDVADLLNRVRPLVEIQITNNLQSLGIFLVKILKNFESMAKTVAKIAKRNIDVPDNKQLSKLAGFSQANAFFSILDFPGAELVQESPSPIKTMGHSVGKIREIMHYLQLYRPADYHRFEVASHVHIFNDICNKSKRWLDDDKYRDFVQAAAKKIFDSLETDRDRLIGKKEENQARELESALKIIKGVLDRVEHHIPKTPRLAFKKLSDKLSGSLKFPNIWRKGPPDAAKKVAPPIILSLPELPLIPANPSSGDLFRVVDQWLQRCDLLKQRKEFRRLESEIIGMTAQIDLNSQLWENFSEHDLKLLVDRFSVLSDHLTVARARQFAAGRSDHIPRAAIASLTLLAAVEKAFAKHKIIPDFELENSAAKRELNSITSNYSIMRGLSAAELKRINELSQHFTRQSFSTFPYINMFKYNTQIVDYYAELYDKKASGKPPETDQIEAIMNVETGMESNYVNGKSVPKPETPLDKRLKAIYTYTDMGDKGILLPEVVAWRKMKALSTIVSQDFTALTFPRSVFVLFNRRFNEVKKRLLNIETFDFALGGKRWLDVPVLGKLVAGSEVYDFWTTNPPLIVNRSEPARTRIDWKNELNITPPIADPVEKKITKISVSSHGIDYYGMRGGGASATYYPGGASAIYYREQAICNQVDGKIREICPEVLKDLLPEEVRDLLDCQLSKNPFPEEAIISQALITYAKHPRFFQRPELQWYFEYLVFGKCANTFFYCATHSEILSNLANWIAEVQKNAIASKDLRASVFAVRVAEKIRQRLPQNLTNTVKSPHAVSISNLLPQIDSIDTLKELAAKFREPEDQKIIYRELLGILAERYQIKPAGEGLEEIKRQLPEILYGHLAIHAVPPSKLKDDPAQTHLINGLIDIILPMIKENPDLVAPAMGRLYPSLEGKKWNAVNGEFPLFTLEAGLEGQTIQVDVSSGLCYRNGLTSGKIPDDVAESSLFAEFFKGREDDLFEWSISYEDGGKAPVITYTCAAVPALRIRYQEKPASIAEKKKIPHQKIVIFKNSDMKGKKPKWMQLAIFSKNDVPPHIWAAIEGKHCWVDLKSPRRVVVLEKSGHPYGEMTVKHGKKVTVAGFKRADGLRLMNLAKHPSWLKQFSTIDKPGNILVYGKGGRAREIEYPFLHLASGESLCYQISRKGKEITLPIAQGYSLAQKGKRPGYLPKIGEPQLRPKALPEDFHDFHLLENMTGKQKVVIVGRKKTQIAKADNTVDFTKILETQNSSPSSLNLEQYPTYFFDVDLDSNRLDSVSVEGNLMLSYLHLTHRDYESALYYLKRADTALPLSTESLQIIEWIREWRDLSPNGVALKLHIELQALRNLSKQTALLATFAGKDRLLQHMQHSAALTLKYLAHEQKIDLHGQGIDPQLLLSQSDLEFIKAMFIENIDSLPLNNLIPHLQVAHQNARQTKNSLEGMGLEQGLGLLQQQAAASGYKISSKTLAIWQHMRPFKNKSLKQFRRVFETSSSNWLVKDFKLLWDGLLKNEPDSLNFKNIAAKIEMAQIFPAKSRYSFISSFFGISWKTRQDIQKLLLDLIKLRRAGKIDSAKAATLLMPQRAYRPSNAVERAFKTLALTETSSTLFNALSSVKNKKSAVGMFFGTVFFMALNTFNPYKPSQKVLDKLGDKLTSDNKSEIEAKLTFDIPHYKVLKKMTDLMEEVENMANEDAKATADAPKPPEVVIAVPKSVEAEYDDHFMDPLDRERMTQVIAAVSQSLSSIDQIQQGRQLKVELIQQSSKDILNRINNPPADPERIHSETPSLEKQLVHQGMELIKNIVVKEETTEWDPNDFIRVASDASEATKRLTEEQRKDFAAFPKEKTHYTLHVKELKKIQQSLKDTHTQQKAQERRIMDDILTKIDNFESPRAILEARRLLGRSQRLSIETLIGLWLENQLTIKGDNNPLRKLGVKISDDDIADLERNICIFMALNSQNAHLERAMAFAHTVGQSIDKKGNAADQENIAALYESLKAERRYSIPADPDYKELLAIEYFNSLIIRKAQLEIFRDMINDPCAVRQLPMGGGKTKLILPLLAKKRANGKNLVMLVLPEWLYKQNRGDLDKTCREVFRQQLFCFDFDRESPTDHASLLKIHATLLETIQNKGFIATTKNSLLSFKHTFVELAKQLETAKDEDLELIYNKVHVAAQILDLFKQRGDVIADEIDSILDIRKETNFALGTPIAIHKEKIEHSVNIMRLILASEKEEIRHIAKAIKENTQAAIPLAQRKSALRAIAEEYRDNNLKIYHADFIDYLVGEDVAADPKTKLPPYIAQIAQDDPERFREISVLKAFLTVGLSTTLARPGNVAYGRDPVSGIWTIPYKASNSPVIGSEFDEEIEKIAYTLQDYIQNGLTYAQIDGFVATLRKEASAELQRRRDQGEENIDIDDTAAGRSFRQLILDLDEGKNFGTTPSLALFTRREKNLLCIKLNQSPEQIIDFCKDWVLKRITISPEQITGNALDFVDMVHHFGGFTGTPWNMHTFHEKIRAKITEGVDGKTYAALFRKKGDIKIRTIDLDVHNPIGSILQSTQFTEKYQALIDAGAYLKGKDNEEFIQEVLREAKSKNLPVASGVYFNNNGMIVAKAQPHTDAILFEYAPAIDLMKQRTLYDDARKIGADIAQGKVARALVTIGEDTYIKDLFQAIWRMRQLDLQQGIDFCISEKVRLLIKKGTPGDPTIEEIIEFCINNQALKEAEDNFRAEKQKISGSHARQALSELVALALNPYDDHHANAFIKKVEDASPLLIKKRPGVEVFGFYAAVKKKRKPTEVLSDLRVVNSLGPKELNPRLLPKDVEELDFSTQTEVMVQQQVKTEQKVQVEVEIENVSAAPPPTDNAYEVDISAYEYDRFINGKYLGDKVNQAQGYVNFSQTVKRGNTTTYTSTAKACRLFGSIEASIGMGFNPEIYSTFNYDPFIAEFKGDSSDEKSLEVQTSKIFHRARKPVHRAIFSKKGNKWVVGILALCDLKNINEGLRQARTNSIYSSSHQYYVDQSAHYKEEIRNSHAIIQKLEEEALAYSKQAKEIADKATVATSNLDQQLLSNEAQRLNSLAKNCEKLVQSERKSLARYEENAKFYEEHAADSAIPNAAIVSIGTPGKPCIIASTNSSKPTELPFTGQDRTEFFERYVQVKFFNGDFEYTGEEREALEKWLSINPQKKREFFEKKILPTRLSDKLSYPRSTLFKIFNKVAPKKVQ